ncbi:restriction endonuclease subunit S [Hydrogenophilus thiooxidans]|uniref:restriction endonuclease subunit S n=1 Tax=Hydrogenophilus thiooxidans TaxID=2820326 RepID=UPI001C215DD8|nr:restriction endonuclease subunit S [Hydrogenophilus thiooxidans]
MTGEWKRLSLADAVDVISGGTPKTSVAEYWNGDIPWLSVADFNNGYRWVNSAEKSITERGLLESATTVLNRGDIIISARGTVGVVAQVAKPMAFNQSCYGIRGRKGLADTNFIYYALRHAVLGMKQVAHGGVFDTITRDTFKIIEVNLPPLSEQRAIAHILGTLDDKIENLRRQNETLEAMARALFRAWFVDFEPVRAKLEGRWRRGESLPGLPAHLYDLFPDRLVDSELGEIPEGWSLSTIGEEVTVCGGSTPSTKESEFWEGGKHCWATPKDLSALKFPVLLDTERKITDAGLAKISSGLLPVGTVLLSSRAPIGYLAIAEVPTAINQGFIAMKCNGTLPSVFMLLWCKENMDAIIGNANGSTFQEISKGNFRPLRVVVPSDPVLTSFTRSAVSLYQQLVQNERESRTLAQLRDTLLPKLISGELRIRDAEAFLKERGL